MNVEIPQEIIIEGVALAFQRWLDARPNFAEQLLTRIAELHAEPMTPEEAARMLGVTAKTLRLNHVDYGVDKSVALGPNEPRYFRSQIVQALKRPGKVIKGRSEPSAMSHPQSVPIKRAA